MKNKDNSFTFNGIELSILGETVKVDFRYYKGKDDKLYDLPENCHPYECSEIEIETILYLDENSGKYYLLLKEEVTSLFYEKFIEKVYDTCNEYGNVYSELYLQERGKQ